MEVTRLVVARARLEGYGEVVAERVDQYHDRFVEALGMPAAAFDWAYGVIVLYFDGREVALRAVLEDEAGEQEAAAEEVDA